MRARAPQGHTVPERAPIALSVGDPVVAGESDTTWPAFVYVITDHGEGWVPARHLAADSGATVVIAGYDTTELPLAADQEVMVLECDDESGWWWCEADDGATGWVPISALVVVDRSDP